MTNAEYGHRNALIRRQKALIERQGLIIQAVKNLHVRVYDGYVHQDVCAECSDEEDGSWMLWPCPTIKAMQTTGAGS